MAYCINGDCISCGACADTCPVGAISEGDAQYVIDADVCISCGSCADGCPVGAIPGRRDQRGIVNQSKKRAVLRHSSFFVRKKGIRD